MGLLPLIFLTVIGLAILAVTRFATEGDRPSPIAVIALAFWTGVIAATFVVIVPAIITGRMFFSLFYILLVAALTFLAVRPRLLLQMLGHGRPSATPDATPAAPAIERPFLTALACLPFLAIIAFNVWEGVSIGSSYGLAAFDTIGNFALKARLWYETGLLYPDQLRDPEYLMYKRTYPPIVPMMECLWAYVMRDWNDQAMKWFFLACWLSVGALIYGLIRARTAPLGAVIGVCLWFSFPVNTSYEYGGAFSGYADVPLALAFLAAVFAARHCHTSRQWPVIVLMACIIGGAGWVKNEGLPFTAALLLWLAWRRAPRKSLLITTGIVTAFFVIYKLTIIGLPVTFEADKGFNHSPEELKERFKAMWKLLSWAFGDEEMWGEKLWWVVGGVWIYKLITKPWRSWFGAELYLFFAMGAVYFGVFMITYYHFIFNFDKLFERLFLHILPLIIVATFAHFDAAPTPRNIAPPAEGGTVTPIPPPSQGRTA